MAWRTRPMCSTLHVVPAPNASGDGGSYLLSMAETRGPGRAALSSTFPTLEKLADSLRSIGINEASIHSMGSRFFLRFEYSATASAGGCPLNRARFPHLCLGAIP